MYCSVSTKYCVLGMKHITRPGEPVSRSQYAHFLTGDRNLGSNFYTIYWSCSSGYIICLHNTLSVSYVHSQPHLP